MESKHTAILEDELKVFESLTDVEVVFDIGARDDVDYLIIKPDIELHAFEPNLQFFGELKANIGDRLNVFLNDFAIGDVEEKYSYNGNTQSLQYPDEEGVVVKRLDNYIKKHKVKKIDFLKIDTEGFDLRVLIGLGKKIKICRYIQYELNRNHEDIEAEKILADNGFTTYYTGYRNQIAVRNGEKMPWIPTEPKEGGLTGKTIKNFL